MERAFLIASKAFPVKLRHKTSSLLKYCGSQMSAEMWLGRAMIISLTVLFSTSLIFYYTVENLWQAMLAVLFAVFLFQMASYLILFLKAESRARAVERVLPNLLQLIAANLNSGMTPFQATKEASRIEFGILKEEIDHAIALSLSTMSFPDALLDMTDRVKSDMFRNVIELFVEGMRTGGPLGTLLNDIAKDIIESLDLRREILTRSKSYILFISIIVVFGTPLLSAVSIHFIRTITGITAEVMAEMPELQNVGGITFGEMTLTADFLLGVSYVNIFLTALIASWLIAIIAEGKDKYMFKYAIVIVPVSVGMFSALDYVISMLL